MTTPVCDILLKQGTLIHPTQPVCQVDIALQDGMIQAIAPRLDIPTRLELDLQGQMVSPPFVESHIHLDAALTAGDPRWNQSGTLFEGIEIWRERKQYLTQEDVKKRAIDVLKQQAMQGILFVRSHADTSEKTLASLKGLLEVRDAVKDWMTLQVVAFPQDGIFGGPDNAELIEEALRLGADIVGGIPHYELTREDGVKSMHWVFELAEKYDRMIDVHCDEIDDDQSRFVEVIVANAIRRSNGDRVTASHTTAFGSYNNAYAFKLMSFIERSGINFVANPLINITLQGRTDTYPKRRGITRVKELWQRGMNVSLGHDDYRDPWYSLGTANMLDVANMAVHACQMTGTQEIDACYDMVTWHGAKTLNVTDQYGIEEGKPANMIVLAASDRYDAIRRRAPVRYVISKGKLIASTEPQKTEWKL